MHANTIGPVLQFSTRSNNPDRGKEHAFVPNPLPPDWQPNEQLCPDIAEAVRVIGVLDGIGRFLPNPAILCRTEDREAIQSSALEGTYATPKELLLFEMSPLEPAADTDASN